MENIKIQLPKELLLSIKMISKDWNGFIVEAIEKQLQRLKERELEKLLEEGYKSSNREASQLSDEFLNVDLENWDEY